MRNMANTVIHNAIFFKLLAYGEDSKTEADNIDEKCGEVEKATLLPCS